MKLNTRLVVPLLFALSAAPLSPLAAQEMHLDQGTYEGVPYLSGGVGERERAYIVNNLASHYNVKMEFAASNGEYLSSVTVNVIDPTGRKVLVAEAQGPWLFAKLTPGKYRVEATADGRTFTNSLVVNDQRTARIVFTGWRPE
jgi:hypothetical protein